LLQCLRIRRAKIVGIHDCSFLIEAVGSIF
jgi:hypothetical protein